MHDIHPVTKVYYSLSNAQFTQNSHQVAHCVSCDCADINGRATKMSQYKGKVVLLVNVASACGFTPQYEGLQSLYDKYKSKGLVVLACPCNAFGGQEPGSNSDIQAFAKRTYGITFPLMAKMEVNGQDAEPLWDWAKSQKGGFLTNDIKVRPTPVLYSQLTCELWLCMACHAWWLTPGLCPTIPQLLIHSLQWNFSKFLISREGEVVGRFGSTTTPEAIEAEVAKLL